MEFEIENPVLSFALDCLPYVGTAKQCFEFAQALHSGDPSAIMEEGIGVAVSLCFGWFGGSNWFYRYTKNAANRMSKKKALQILLQKGINTPAGKKAAEVLMTKGGIRVSQEATEQATAKVISSPLTLLLEKKTKDM